MTATATIDEQAIDVQVIEAPKAKRTRKPKAAAIDPLDVDFVEQEDQFVQVDARTGYRPVHGYDDTGALKEIGIVRYQDFAGPGGTVRTLTLENSETGKTHPLGTVSNGFKTRSHAQILRPFIDAGFVPRKMVYSTTGVACHAVLSRPDVTFADAIEWDRGWLLDHSEGTVRAVQGDPKMELSVRVSSDLRAGRAYSAQVGFFRLICTNGLVAEILGLGSFWANHRNFSQDKFNAFVSEMSATADQMPTAPTGLIDDVLRALETAGDDLNRLPRLLRTPAAVVLEHTKGAKGEAFRENLIALSDGKSEMTKLDLLNCQTNVAHVTDRPWGVYNNTDMVVKALTDLVELAGVKHDIPTFEFSAN